MSFPYNTVGKESACNSEDLGSIPGLGRCLGEGNGYPLQYSGLQNSGHKESGTTERVSLPSSRDTDSMTVRYSEPW